jgi:Fic family protein/plasmid maintenance system antidote protein VapI
MKTLQQLIKTKREEQGLLIRNVAAVLNIDAALVSRFENGSRKPTEKQVVALAQLFGANERQWLVQWMSEKIVTDLSKNEWALEALMVAEETIRYQKKEPSNVLPKGVKSKLKEIDRLKKQLNGLRKMDSFRIVEALELEYTYESNRIEGNTLTLKETDLVINEGLTISGKSMREHLEAINHREAIEFVKELAAKKTVITQHTLLSIHNLILRSIDSENAGKYRTVQVIIKGSKHLPPSPLVVQEQMDAFFVWYNKNRTQLHPVLLAAEIHERLVTIHPFIDGNGRTARLLMNLVLLQHGYIIANIKGDYKTRMAYYTHLENAQTENRKTDFWLFVIEAETEALLRYISIVS